MCIITCTLYKLAYMPHVDFYGTWNCLAPPFDWSGPIHSFKLFANCLPALVVLLHGGFWLPQYGREPWQKSLLSCIHHQACHINHQRKFRNLTSDYTESCCWRFVNQEMWSRRCDTAEMWDMRIWQVGRARNAVFFHSFVASPARKVRS